MKETDMTQRYRKFKRTWGMYYAYDNVTGNSVSLKTRVKAEAQRRFPHLNVTLKTADALLILEHSISAAGV